MDKLVNDYKLQILNFFKGIHLKEETHQYTLGELKINISVSGVIKKFVQYSNWKKICEDSAQKKGISAEKLQQAWDNKRDKSCRIGTETHYFGELYPFNKHLKPSTGLERAVVAFWNDVPSTIIPILMEVKMYHKEYLFAGTCDILLYDTISETFILGDYKTNIDLFKNYKNKTLKPPFAHLLDNPFNKYQIQLSLYQILFEQIGLKISSRKLIWLKPDGTYLMYDTQDYTDILNRYLKDNKL